MKQILCFGDSNTYGLIPGTKARYDWNIRWSGILGERMRPYGYRVVEEGLCGRTTVFDDLYRDGRNASKMLQAILETHDPIDRIILMLGTNDCKSAYNATPEDIGAGIELLLEQIEILHRRHQCFFFLRFIWEKESGRPDMMRNLIKSRLRFPSGSEMCMNRLQHIMAYLFESSRLCTLLRN